MSDLSPFDAILKDWSYLSIPLGVFVASILGSTHCASMCGPIAITVNNSGGYMPLYHVGRLLSYLVLGALAGLLGEAFLSGNFGIVSTFSVIFISAFFIYTGYRLIRGKPLDIIPARLITSLLSKPAKWSFAQGKALRSLTIGIVNGFLPCGWVYIFVVGAVAAKNPLYGAGILFVFWLGTVPMLSALPFAYKKTIGRGSRKLVVAAGIVLILVGIANVAIHALPGQHSAHSAHTSHQPEHSHH